MNTAGWIPWRNSVYRFKQKAVRKPSVVLPYCSARENPWPIQGHTAKQSGNKVGNQVSKLQGSIQHNTLLPSQLRPDPTAPQPTPSPLKTTTTRKKKKTIHTDLNVDKTPSTGNKKDFEAGTKVDSVSLVYPSSKRFPYTHPWFW